MTELRENCTWRRCSVSRVRFRLKLYEPVVKCLGEASDVGQRLKFLALRLSLDSNIFAPARKAVLSQSFSLIRHSSLSVYMYRSIRYVWLSRENAVLLSRVLSTATNRESTFEVKSEIRNV